MRSQIRDNYLPKIVVVRSILLTIQTNAVIRIDTKITIKSIDCNNKNINGYAPCILLYHTKIIDTFRKCKLYYSKVFANNGRVIFFPLVTHTKHNTQPLKINHVCIIRTRYRNPQI